MTETTQPDPMEVLIDRSGKFEEAILRCFPEAGVVLAMSTIAEMRTVTDLGRPPVHSARADDRLSSTCTARRGPRFAWLGLRHLEQRRLGAAGVVPLTVGSAARRLSPNATAPR